MLRIGKVVSVNSVVHNLSLQLFLCVIGDFQFIQWRELNNIQGLQTLTRDVGGRKVR